MARKTDTVQRIRRTKKDILAENEELKLINQRLDEKIDSRTDWLSYTAMIALSILMLAIGLGVILGPMNACPEVQESVTLDKLYTLDQEGYEVYYDAHNQYGCYSLTFDNQLRELWHDIEAITDFEHDSNPVEITDVTVHYRYNTPQEADYIEGTWEHELGSRTMRLENVKIYPDPPVWGYNSITIYPSGEDVSQTYGKPKSEAGWYDIGNGTVYYFSPTMYDSFTWEVRKNNTSPDWWFD